MATSGGCCQLVETDVTIFKPLNKRWCTDILCLLLFIIYFIVQIIIMIFSLNNGEINYIFYPTDYLGQFCGHTPGVRDRPKAFYPQLSEDIQSQSALFALGGPVAFATFTPKVLCVEECPPSFSLANPRTYGGNDYPGANPNVSNRFYYQGLPTSEIFNRCLPRIDSQPGLDRQLCAVPACNNATAFAERPACAGVNAACTAIDSTPSVTTAWVVSNAADAACCDFQVQEVNTQSFLPPTATAESTATERQFATYVSSAFGIMRALSESLFQVLIMGLAAPFAFAFVWFIMLFLFAGFIIVLALLAFLVGLVALTCYLYYRAGWADGAFANLERLANFSSISSVTTLSSDDLSQTVYAVLAVIMTLITLMYLIFIIVSRQSIERCIAVVRETTKVFCSLPFMTVWPMVGVVFYLAVLVYAVMIGGFIATQDTNTFAEINEEINRFDDSSAASTGASSFLNAFASQSRTVRIGLLLTVHIVGCIWALFIVQGAVYTTLSRSAAVWFFSHEYSEAQGEVVQAGTFFGGVRVVTSCAWCVFSRHLGSIAFGSAILTIMSVIRLILEAINHYTKDYQATNLLLTLVIKIAQCCVWCLDRTVKFITYYGYIFVAIEGSNFCTSCLATFAFLFKHPTQVTTNKMVATILSCVISLSIPTAATLIGFIWIDQMSPNRPGPVWCAISIFVLAYVIASAITDVFRCTIDTIFVCAFKDMEEHQPPKYMSMSLRKGFDLDDKDIGSEKLKTGESGGVSFKQKQESGTEMNARM